MKTVICTFLLIFAVYLSAKAQSTSLFVDSLKIFPTYPTQNDSITFVAYTRHPNTGDSFYDKQIIKVDSIISIYSCWVSGPLFTYDYRTDTTTIGKFNSGNYKIRYIQKFLLHSELDSVEPCLTNPYYDSTFLNFTVSSINSISQYTNISGVEIFPNPASSTLTITQPNPQPNTTLQILNLQGQTIPLLFKEGAGSGNFTADVSLLPPGIYFAVLQNNEQRAVKRFVKQ